MSSQPRALPFLILSLLLFVGCVNTQILPALNFSVRVIDFETGMPVSGAQVFATLGSGTEKVPSIKLGPLTTDQRGIVQVVSPERAMQIRGFDHNWIGGFDSWPWLRVVHPDYENSGHMLPSDTEEKVRKKEEIVFKLQKKKAPGTAP